MPVTSTRHLSLYWQCQLAGWSVASLYWGYIGYVGGTFSMATAIVHFTTDVFFYILLTHQYRNVALRFKWTALPLGKMVRTIIPAILVLAVIYVVVTLAKIYILRSLFVPGFDLSIPDFTRMNIAGIFMAGIRLMSIWVLAYHLYHYAQREISMTKENAQLEMLAKDIRLNNLVNQLNPHFLFNSLNNIKFLVNSNPADARRAIDLLADLLRHSLDRSHDKLVTLDMELQLVSDYLELERLRFESRMQVEIARPENVTDIFVPPLSVQTLAENAVKHGIDKSVRGGLVDINIRKSSGKVVVEVTSPGTLTASGSNEGVGLKNLRERIKLQFGEEATLSVSNGDNVVKARLVIPEIMNPSVTA